MYVQFNHVPSSEFSSLSGIASYLWTPPTDIFHHAANITLTLDNHNNSIWGGSVYHFHTNSDLKLPVHTGVNIFLWLHYQGFQANTLVIYYHTSPLRLIYVTDSYIISVLIRYNSGWIFPPCIFPISFGTNYIHYGGVIAIHIEYLPFCTLISIVRWFLLKNMIYTQKW